MENFDINTPVSVENLGNSAIVLTKMPALSISGHYGMLRIYSINLKNLDLASLCIMSLTDFSGKFYNTASFNVENITLSAGIFTSFGDDHSEFKLYGEQWGLNQGIEIVF